MSEVELTINGKQLKGQKGQTILEVAMAEGIEIPNLCYDPRLKPTGACRMCLVEIEGVRGLQTSCTRLIEPGMVVHTETEEIRDTRKTILELLFSEHKGACTTCDDNGNCVLQELAYQYRLDESIFSVPTETEPRPNYTTGNEGIVYNPDKCIRCERCIRICEEVQMDFALTFKERAAKIEVSTAFDRPLNDSTCEMCGQCISTCPTGALYERAAIGQGQAKDMVRTRTTCPYCGVGCQIDLNVHKKKKTLVRATSEVGVIPNDGNLCVKGRFGLHFVNHSERLKTPLIKRNGKFEEASWDEAIEYASSRLKEIKEKHGADAIAGLASARCTNEENYVFQKFMRAGIGTNNIDHCARLCHSSTVAGLARAFGSGAMTNSIAEFKDAECIFIIGSNTTEAHPVIGLVIKEAAVKNGCKIIVADPRRIDICRFAHMHMQQRPGTDVALLNGMMNVILEEGLADEEYIQERTEDFDAVAEIVKEYTPEKVEAITTIPAEMIREAARTYAKAKTASIVYSMGITQHSTGTDNVLSIANLAMMTGNVGKASTGVNPLRGQNNVQGACDLGGLPNVYSGYQKVEDEAARNKMEEAWGVPLPDKNGKTIVEIVHGVKEDHIKALYIMGENPALSDPNLNSTRKSLEEVELLIVQDIFLTETAQYADVVLPTTCFAEKDGTYTNTERRVQRIRKAIDAPGQSKDDWQIVCELSTAMGYPMDYANASEIMDEIALVTPIYGGISYARIDEVGLQWPCPDRKHPGTPYLHKDKFARGKGKFHPVHFIEPKELPSEEFPLILSTGRQLYQYHTGTMSRKSPVVNQISPYGYVELHPELATRYKIQPEDLVEVETRRGRVETHARVTPNIAKSWIFMPFHFAEGPANMLTNDVLDPIAKIPEFKVCAARIKKLG